MSDERGDCSLCGWENIPKEDADQIEKDMEFDHMTCPHCGMCYWEVRDNQEAEEDHQI